MRAATKRMLSLALVASMLLSYFHAVSTPASAAMNPDDTAGVFGWEECYDAAIAYMDGSYRIRDGKNMVISFGIYNNPPHIDWYLEDDWIPMLTTEFERDNCTVKISNFGYNVTISGNDFCVAYSRVSIRNHGSAAVTLDPKASPALIRLTGNPVTVQPGATVNHDYLIAIDRYGNKYDYPTDSVLKAAAPSFDDAHTAMVAYWTHRVEEGAYFAKLPDDRVRKTLMATLCQLAIISDGGLYGIGENGYDGGGAWKGDQMEMTVYELEFGNLYKMRENMIDSQWYQWNEDAVWWKSGWQWYTYLQKTADIAFVKERFINLPDQYKPADPANPDFTNPKNVTADVALAFIEASIDPVKGVMKESNIDTMGNWIMGDFNALIGLTGIKYISQYMLLHDANITPAETAKYHSFITKADELYERIYTGCLRMMNDTITHYDLNYLPLGGDQSNQQNRMMTPNDGNWASAFFVGRWLFEGYLFGADQGGRTVTGGTFGTRRDGTTRTVAGGYVSPLFTKYIDRTFDYGLGRLIGMLPPYDAGGFPGYSNAYNASYGSGALRGERYRSYGLYALQFLLDNQQSPNGWGETILDPAYTPAGVRPVGYVGSVPHMWGNTSSDYAFFTGVAVQKFNPDPDLRDLIIGRGIPREWLMEGKETELKNYNLSGPNERIDIGIYGLANNSFNVTLSGAAPTGNVSLEMAALLDDNVSGVTADGVTKTLADVYDSVNGTITLPGDTKSITVTLKDAFPYVDLNAATDGGSYAREPLDRYQGAAGDSFDVKVTSVLGEDMQTGFTKMKSLLNFQVYVAEEGDYNLTVDYAGNTVDKRLSTYVNSNKDGLLIFAPSAASKNAQSQVVHLKEGINNITLKNDFKDNEPSISIAAIHLSPSDGEALGQNVLYGRTASSSPALSNPGYLTDGYTATGSVSTAANQTIQFDLDQDYLINRLSVAATGASGITVSLSEEGDFVNATTFILDNGVKFDEVRTRYIRLTTDAANSWQEIQAFGTLAPPKAEQDTAGKAINLLEAEYADDLSQVTVYDLSPAGKAIKDIGLNDYIVFRDVNFGNGDVLMDANVASNANAGATIEFRIDNLEGQLLGSLAVPNTGSRDTFRNTSGSLHGAEGVHDLYLKFTGGGGGGQDMFSLDWVRLHVGGLRSVMVFGPHPDDETLATAGIIHQAVLDHVPVKVVVVLNGGDSRPEQGRHRMEESYQAAMTLGVKPQDIIFLGYGDNLLSSLLSSPSSNTVFTSSEGFTTTYGSDTHSTLHKLLTGQEAQNSRSSFLGDISYLIDTFQPTEVYAPTPYDNHPDHKNVRRAVETVLGNAVGNFYNYNPTLYGTMIQLHFAFPGSANPWPEQEVPSDLNAPMRPFTEPLGLEQYTPLKWDDRISVPVPADMMVLPRNQNIKYKAIMCYDTAINQDPQTWLSYVKSDEIFFPQYTFETDDTNLVNVAKNKNVTSNANVHDLSMVVDEALGDHADLSTGSKWVQVDFGQSYDISVIRLWHFFDDGRVYNGVVVQLSNDPDFKTGVTTVFNNDVDNLCGQGAGTDALYAESAGGKRISFDAIHARYVRAWSCGSTSNPSNHVVELKAYTADPSAQYVGTALADNGTLTLTLDTPDLPVTAADFTATIAVDGKAAVHLALDDFAYDEATKTATFTFPKVERQEHAQDVEIAIQYKSGKFPLARFRVPGTVIERTNLALGIQATVSPALPAANVWQIPYATDGSIEEQANPPQGTDPLGYIDASNGFTWVTLDLGEEYLLDEVKLWHYYPDGRTYKEVLVQISSDPNFALENTITLFNNDTANAAGYGAGDDAEYAETKSGKSITFAPQKARYIRTSANGSNKNGNSHFVEIMVFGVPTSSTLKLDIDGNGVVNDADRDWIYRYFSGWDMGVVTAEQLAAMDVNSDGAVNAIDKVLITRYFAGWDLSFD